MMLQILRRRRARAYDPSVVDIVLRQRDRWIAESHADSVWEGVLESEPEPHVCLAQNRLDDALSAFAKFTDLTCPSG